MSTKLEVDVVAKLYDEITGEISKVKGSLNTLKTSTDELAKSNGMLGTSGKKGADGVTEVATASGTAHSKVSTFAKALPGVINGLANIATSAVLLARNYRDLGDSQQQVDKTALALSKKEEALVVAQGKLNDLVAKGVTSGPEYEKALLDVQQAQDAVEIATTNHSEAIERQSDIYVDFALSVIPGVLGVLGSLSSMWLQNKVAAEASAVGIDKVAASSSKFSQLIKVGGPIGAAIAAIAIGLTLIKTNAFGFRDALNEIGNKLTATFPALKGVVQWAKDLGAALAITSDKLDFKKAWDLLVSGFKSAVDQISKFDWSAAISSMGKSISAGLNNWNWDDAWTSFHEAMGTVGEWVNNGVTAIADAIKGEITIDNAKLWWAGFYEALGSSVDWVITGIKAIGKAMVSEIKGQSVNDLWWKGMQDAMWATLTWVATGIGNIGIEIAKQILKIATGWWEGFRLGLYKDLSWVPTAMAKVGEAILKWGWEAIGGGIWTKIGKGITDALGGIGKGATDLGTQIQKGLGIIPTSFQPGGGKKEGQKVDETGAPVGDQMGGAAAAAGGKGLGIAEMFATEMKLALALVTAGSAKISAVIQTMAQQIATSMLQMQTSVSASIIGISTALLGMSTAVNLVPAVFQKMAQQIATVMLQMQTSVSASIVGIGQALSGISSIVSVVTPVFQKMAQQIAVLMLQMQTSVSASIVGIAVAFQGIAGIVTATGTVFTALSTVVTTAVTAMNTQIGVFATTTKTQFTAVGTSMKGLQTASSTLSTTISSHMKSMTSSVSSFASSFSSNMSKITSSMKTATSAANSLASAIAKLKSKTITITTRYVTTGSPGGMHGTQFLSHAQHGGSGIVNRPTTFRGTRMGEGFRPELVTVTPLTRGTGNHAGPTVSSDAMGGGGQVINNITVVLDGRVIQRFVEKTALSGVGMQV